MPHDWLPMAAVAVASFLGGAVTAALAVGGGLILLAVLGMLLPPAALIPVHGAMMWGINGARAGVFRRAIDWPAAGIFLGGATIGAAIGGGIVVTLPAEGLRLSVAGFILFTQWGPRLRLPGGDRSLVPAGAISTFLTLFVGASGPFVTSVLSTFDRLDRHGLMGTAAACMVIQHGLKVAVFALGGFVFAPWLPLIGVSVAAGLAGTMTGAAILSRIDEGQFRRALRWGLTALACLLAGLAVRGLLSGA